MKEKFQRNNKKLINQKYKKTKGFVQKEAEERQSMEKLLTASLGDLEFVTKSYRERYESYGEFFRHAPINILWKSFG